MSNPSGRPAHKRPSQEAKRQRTLRERRRAMGLTQIQMIYWMPADPEVIAAFKEQTRAAARTLVEQATGGTTT